jgi:ribosome hibernation promoting factor
MFSIRVHGIEWTDELRDEVERSIAFAIDRYGTQLHHISVYLSDLNGPKGGVDKICQITASLKRGSSVLILEKGSETVPMVNRAVSRLGYRIGRRIQRWKQPAARSP